MKKLDRGRSYGVVAGHSWALFEQDGVLFNGAGETQEGGPDPVTIETNELNGAKAFLSQILKGGPLSKATIYKAAGENNQPWPDVKAAAEDMKIVTFSYKNAETWKLNEEV